jgi:DNA replication protein DnaC
MYDLSELSNVRRMWIKMANVPAARRGWLLDDCKDVDATTVDRIRSWVKLINTGDVIRASSSKNCGKGVLLWGEPGHGKTTLALATIQEILTTFKLDPFKVEANHVLLRPCYFTTFNDILDLKGKTMDNEATEDEQLIFKGMLGECDNDAYNIRVLIIDDLGKEHRSLSGWQSNMFHHVLRTRFNHGLPTIVTTNVELKHWAAAYGDATESFANEAFRYLPVITSDLRK